MTDQDLLEQLGLFDPASAEEVRAVRRPAGPHLLIEFQPKVGLIPLSLAGFWLGCLWRFLEDSQQSSVAFEGLAFQSLPLPLTAEQFREQYGAVRSHLTLPPPYPLQMRSAYRLLSGRLNAFAGIDIDGTAWAGFFQTHVFEV